jgi:hypothetical protein
MDGDARSGMRALQFCSPWFLPDDKSLPSRSGDDQNLQHQLILGDEAFIASAQAMAPESDLAAVSKAQRRAINLTLADYDALYPNRDEAMACAYRSTAYTMEQIAVYFHVSAKTISRAVKRLETDQPVSECRH